MKITLANPTDYTLNLIEKLEDAELFGKQLDELKFSQQIEFMFLTQKDTNYSKEKISYALLKGKLDFELSDSEEYDEKKFD